MHAMLFTRVFGKCCAQAGVWQGDAKGVIEYWPAVSC